MAAEHSDDLHTRHVSLSVPEVDHMGERDALLVFRDAGVDYLGILGAENALVYLLGNILLVIVVYTSLRIRHIEVGLVWTICLMVSLVSLIGIIIFKGRKVSDEIQKRMNF